MYRCVCLCVLARCSNVTSALMEEIPHSEDWLECIHSGIGNWPLVTQLMRHLGWKPNFLNLFHSHTHTNKCRHMHNYRIHSITSLVHVRNVQCVIFLIFQLICYVYFPICFPIYNCLSYSNSCFLHLYVFLIKKKQTCNWTSTGLLSLFSMTCHGLHQHKDFAQCPASNMSPLTLWHRLVLYVGFMSSRAVLWGDVVLLLFYCDKMYSKLNPVFKKWNFSANKLHHK